MIASGSLVTRYHIAHLTQQLINIEFINQVNLVGLNKKELFQSNISI